MSQFTEESRALQPLVSLMYITSSPQLRDPYPGRFKMPIQASATASCPEEEDIYIDATVLMLLFLTLQLSAFQLVIQSRVQISRVHCQNIPDSTNTGEDSSHRLRISHQSNQTLRNRILRLVWKYSQTR